MKYGLNQEKNYYTNEYKYDYSLKENKIKIIKPNNIFIKDRVLFSNISLCKKNVIFTSIYYRNDPWIIDDIFININENIEISKNIFQNNDYESSFNIIIEIDKFVETLDIEISYKNIYFFKINLKQLNIDECEISCMTMFKDDYLLLKRYIKYYYNLGIKLFFLYINDIYDNTIYNFDFIEELINDYGIYIYI